MSEAFLDDRAVAARPLLDRLDPRSRILASVVAVAVVLALRSPPVLAASTALAIGLALAVGAKPGDLLRRLAHVEGFLAVLLVLLPLTVPGPDWARLGPLVLSQPGVDRAVLVVLRVTLAAVVIFTLVAGLEPVRFGHALARLGMPRKLVHLLLFTVRFVALLRDEVARRHDSLRARAFRPRTSIHTLRTLAHLTGRLLVGAVERAERVDEAMRCRAFTGRFALVDGGGYGTADRRFAVVATVLLLLPLVTERLT